MDSAFRDAELAGNFSIRKGGSWFSGIGCFVDTRA
jgi:hypothetical protein